MMNFSRINIQGIIKNKNENQIRINFNPWDVVMLDNDKNYYLTRAVSIIIKDFEFVNLDEIVFFDVGTGVISASNLKEFKIGDLMNNDYFKNAILEELENNNIYFVTEEEISELYNDKITLLNYDVAIALLKEKVEQTLIDNNKELFMTYTNQIKELNIQKEKLFRNHMFLCEKDKEEINNLFNDLDSLFEKSKLNVLIDEALLNKNEKLFNKYIKEYEKLELKNIEKIDK